MDRLYKSELANRKYWRDLATLCGWKVLVWAYRREVTYKTDSGLLEMTGKQRDQIMAVIVNGTGRKEGK